MSNKGRENGCRPAHSALSDGDILRGLTKREYIAAMAMQGMIANPHIQQKIQVLGVEEVERRISSRAVKYADGLLNALEEERKVDE